MLQMYDYQCFSGLKSHAVTQIIFYYYYCIIQCIKLYRNDEKKCNTDFNSAPSSFIENPLIFTRRPYPFACNGISKTCIPR